MIARQAPKRPTHSTRVKILRKYYETGKKKVLTSSGFEEVSIRQISSWRALSFKASRISLEEAAAKIQS